MTLFLYVLKEYLKYVIGTVVLTLFLFILFDFIHKSTKYFAEYEPSSAHIVQFYAYQIPAQIVQALPIAALLASVICMVLLSRTNEITAMRAAGMGPLAIAMPLAAGGLLLSLVSLVLGEVFVPRFSQRMHYVQQVLIEGESDKEIAEGARWVRDGKNLIHFRDYDPILKALTGVKIVEVRPNFRPKQSIDAALAVYVPTDESWRLSTIQISHFKRNGTLEKIEDSESMSMKLPLSPEKLRKERRKSNELAIDELRDMVARGEASGADTLRYKVDFHIKLAYPFAAFVVSLIGLKFGYRSERATETAKGVLFAFLIGIAYWFILSSGRALGNRGTLHPFVAAWVANVVVLTITLIDAWRARVTA